MSNQGNWDTTGLTIPPTLTAFVSEITGSNQSWINFDLKAISSSEALLNLEGEPRRAIVLDASRLMANLQAQIRPRYALGADNRDWLALTGIKALFNALARGRLNFNEVELLELIGFAQKQRDWDGLSMAMFVGMVEHYAKTNELSQYIRQAVSSLVTSIQARHGTPAAGAQKLINRLNDVLGVRANKNVLKQGEPWADTATAEIASLPLVTQSRWIDLLNASAKAGGTVPSKKFLTESAKLVKALGEEEFKTRLSNWMEIAGTKSSKEPNPMNPGDALMDAPINRENADVLKGLVWAAAGTGDVSFCAPIGDLTERCYKKLPWFGPRCPKVGNAGVAALAIMDGDEPAAQLARLKQKVKQPSGRKMIEKALTRFANRAGLTPEQVEERGVPTFQLDADATRRDQVGEFTAITRVVDGEVEIEWVDAEGKPRKQVPAAVKTEHKEAFRQLQATHKQMKATLTAQVSRLERLLFTQRSLPFEEWRTLYLNQPLLSAFVRRMLWMVGDQSVLPTKEGLTDAAGKTVQLQKDAAVAAWHPALRSQQEVLAWRTRLESLQITQPFKQAHREIYLLTDAERRTDNYSNRFAAHVLRQHQFAALCQQRGWTYRLQGTFDSHNTPTIDLPQHNLKVEYWVEPGLVEGDVGPTGIFLHVVTDQVRFVNRESREPVRLQDVPPLVFSEMLRDVDLFVGVASVGNDPTWQDGGPGGRYQTYWQSYSFGELSATAQTRKVVLQTLLPKLTKLKDHWKLEEKFLVIRGDLRTYKIHLGSANILMEPNDQYLCIVPDRSTKKSENVFLPFEGDATLSIILSKAFLLAADKKINDPSITRQVNQK